MPRLNVYLSDETFKLAERWRGKINLSEICARALAEELEAREAGRTAKGLRQALRRPSDIEREFIDAFALADAVIAPVVEHEPVRDTLGRAAAQYLQRYLGDGGQLAIAGGRQMWSMVQSVEPRPLRVAIAALGFRPHDPRVLHAHANTLATMLWLLFSPRADAHLIGDTESVFALDPVERAEPRYFVIGSCAPYDKNGPFAKLLDGFDRRHLQDAGVFGDFAYQFFDSIGRPVQLHERLNARLLDREKHLALVRRTDARVIAVAGGADKIQVLHRTIDNGLCNTVITDEVAARKLLKMSKR